MVATTADRVARHTRPSAAERIRHKTALNAAYFAQHPEEIPQRLRELDREWDIERTLETSSAAVTLLGLILGASRNRKWFFLSAAVQGFFLQHALQGWCPPLPLLRSFGVRTLQEIEGERYALLAIQEHGARAVEHPEGVLS
jgi:hypothetical protein